MNWFGISLVGWLGLYTIAGLLSPAATEVLRGMLTLLLVMGVCGVICVALFYLLASVGMMIAIHFSWL